MAKKRNIRKSARRAKSILAARFRRIKLKPIDPSSPNPYFRRYPSELLARAKSRQRSELLASRLKLLGKLKPRKGDKGRIVFVGVRRVRKKGKYFLQVFRPNEKELRSVPVYALLASKGRFSVLNDPDPRTIAKGVKLMPQAQRLDSFDVRRMQKKPVVYKRYLDRLNKIFQQKVIVGKIRLPRGTVNLKDEKGKLIPYLYSVKIPKCDLDVFYQSAISIWKQLVESQFRKQTVWQLLGMAIYRDGKKTKMVEFSPKLLSSARFYEIAGTGKLVKAIGKTKSSKVVYTDKYLLDLYSRFIHAGMAGALGDVGVFSKSSVRRIASLPQNRGKARRNWTTRSVRGKKMDWPAWNKRPICIEEVIFRFVPRF